MGNKFEIIAETAFSHEGNFKYLLAQIKSAKLGEVDYIKFQIYIDKDTVYSKNHPNYKIVGNWIIDKEKWLQAFTYAKSLKLKIIALPLALSSLDFCIENDELIDAYEVHSVCFNEYYLLKKLSNVNKEIILGIGGRYPEEINYAIETLCANKKKLILMYGFQSFPTNIAKIDLGKIKVFSDIFCCKMGYADHTKFNNDSFYNLIEYSYLLSARLFEKHIVLEKGEKRIDYESAIISEDFIKLKNRLNKLSSIIGNGKIFKLNNKEIQYRKREKQIVAARNINKSETISLKDLAYKIIEDKSDFEQNEIYKIIGKKCNLSIQKDDPIKFKNLK
jgi:N,N'-diacetyllegionaminate synthase